MDAAQTLGYPESPHYLRAEADFPGSQELAYVLRKAKGECGLRGVYVLRHEDDNASPIPVVYFCQAASKAEARCIHQRVWNQGVVPFVLIQMPESLGLYSGFHYRHPTSEKTEAAGVLKATIAFNEVPDHLAAFQARSIDDGTVWKEWGDAITPETRVDWTLLANLKNLDKYLRGEGVSQEISHALIGKFVYFRYLRDRHILSDSKIAQWHIDPRSVFGRNADLESFLTLDKLTHDWLNGAIFPLDTDALHVLSSSLFQQVAGVFSGDTVEGQLHLDFEPYDFSFIPIEMLSVIYEQFLHVPENGQTTTRGRQSGAYYTPLPLIAFMQEEMERKRPLAAGMTILDPACGSGAFLVQCYRRLIEKQQGQAQRPLRPEELRDILTTQIFGVERDGDTCRVAELSLILTLLDYVTLQDLESSASLLPRLRDTNIFETDLFVPDSPWAQMAAEKKFDWIIGNPPWIELSSRDIREEDRHVWQWMRSHAEASPVGGNQVAEAFAWKTLPYLAPGGVAGLVLPAMTLFKKASIPFRKRFFEKVRTWCVANFANLSYVLFAGRATRPAAVFFFQSRHGSFEEDQDETILTYAPLVVNQEANRPDRPGKRKQTWNITINAAEMQEISASKAVTGEMLPWKLAMWGCFRDARLLQRVARKFPVFRDFAEEHDLVAHQGFELRERSSRSREPLEAKPELVGKKRIDFRKLRGRKRLFVFPNTAINTITEEKCNIRLQGGLAGLVVSQPPHIIVDAGRRFAVYSEEFIAVPYPQIGIASASDNEILLKALSLYLSSDFVTYQQFFTTSEWGVSTSRAILDSLQNLPIPLEKLSKKELNEWANLRDTLAEMSRAGSNPQLGEAFGKYAEQHLTAKITALNERVYSLLGLRESERILVQDFVTTNMQCLKGKVTREVLRVPSESTMQSYVQRLRHELDAFIDGQPEVQHEIDVSRDSRFAMLAIRLARSGTRRRPSMGAVAANDGTSREFERMRERLLQQHSQWMYFNRNLRTYDQDTVYCFKPMQALHWTQRQAILDADEVIAEALVAEE